MSFSDQEMNEFKTEATELLSTAEEALLALETGADFKSKYDAVFRAFHSVKGAAGMMELFDLQACVHQLETHLVAVKDESSLTREQITYFLSGCDATRALLDGRAAQPLSAFPGRGATPVESEVVVHLAEINQASRERAGRVLVLDDEEPFIGLLTSIFQENGYQVTGFTDPREAVQYVINGEVDVVFTDVRMPGMNGVEVLSAIRKIDAEIPVIFVTGECTREDLIQAIKQGVFAVVEKPWKMEALLNLAEKAVRLRRLNDLVNGSLSLLMAQFSNFDQVLKNTATPAERSRLKADVLKLLDQRKYLRRAG